MNDFYRDLIARNKWIQIGWVIIAVVSAILSARNGGDFDVFLDAGAKLGSGQNIYEPPFVHGLQYYYSVFFALLLRPFSAYPFATEMGWILLSWACVYRSLILLLDFYDWTGWKVGRLTALFFLFGLLAFQFLFYNVANIQMTPFLLWAVLESHRLSETKHPLWAGLLLGLAINIKIIPVLVLPYFLYRGFYKTIAGTLLTLGLLYWLPALFIGFERNAFLHQEWWRIVNPLNRQHMVESEIGPHSLVAWLPTLLMETEGSISGRRHLLNLPVETTMLLVQLVRGVLLLLCLYFFQSRFEGNTAVQSKVKRAWEFAYVLMLIPLLMPHQQKYSFLFVMPMILYLLFAFFQTTHRTHGKTFQAMKVLFGIAMLVYSPLHGKDVLGAYLFEWSQHLHLLTWSTLLLIPIAMYCTPTRTCRSDAQISK